MAISVCKQVSLERYQDVSFLARENSKSGNTQSDSLYGSLQGCVNSKEYFGLNLRLVFSGKRIKLSKTKRTQKMDLSF